YAGRIWSFEPVSYVYETLAQVAAKDPMWSVSKLALGSAPGEAPINVSHNHTLSSFLPPSGIFSSYDVQGPTVQESVRIDTLDRVLGNDAAKSIFLKLDVQGFEREVLEG